MNKFGQEFMGKFDLGDMDIEDFFQEDMELIDSVVTKAGWYKYWNSYDIVEIIYRGETIDEVTMKELREEERLFLGDGTDSYKIEVREDFIDIEDICYVHVG